MQVSATVRVKPESGNKPARERLEQAAKLLEESGFNVLRVGRFGVSIKGEDSDFSRVLGVSPSPNKPLATPVTPSQPALRDLVDLVEVVPNPQYFTHA